jgi:hypothetical protein
VNEGLEEIISVVLGAATGWVIAYCALFLFFFIKGKNDT